LWITFVDKLQQNTTAIDINALEKTTYPQYMWISM